MFKKSILLTFCLITTVLCANENPTTEKKLEIGRYQFCVDETGFYIYLLDTAKGTIWMYNYSTSEWEQLTTIPI